MVNLIHLGMLGIVILAVLGIVSNTSETSLLHIEQQMFLANCPYPIYNGVATLNSIDGYAVNYTVVKSDAIQADFNGTRFDCTVDPLSAPPQIGASAAIVEYGASTFWGTIPYGYITYIADNLYTFASRALAGFTLVSFFVAPTNFNILGYTIDDIGGTALFFVIGLYGFCYITIAFMLYKVASPFSGAS